MQGITPCLWFDDQLEEAVAFYASVFPDAVVGEIQRKPDGTAFVADFELAGQRFTGLNGGPMFRFTEAVSFMVACDDQAEIDRFWSVLTADGGEESMCGWLKDRSGLSWQIVPAEYLELAVTGTPEQVDHMNERLFTMRKIDLAALRAAWEGEPAATA